MLIAFSIYCWSNCLYTKHEFFLHICTTYPYVYFQYCHILTVEILLYLYSLDAFLGISGVIFVGIFLSVIINVYAIYCFLSYFAKPLWEIQQRTILLSVVCALGLNSIYIYIYRFKMCFVGKAVCW